MASDQDSLTKGLAPAAPAGLYTGARLASRAGLPSGAGRLVATARPARGGAREPCFRRRPEALLLYSALLAAKPRALNDGVKNRARRDPGHAPVVDGTFAQHAGA